MRRLPRDPLALDKRPPTVDRATWQAQLDNLLVREKAHTRQGDALAAARRRLPMTEVPPTATITGPAGEVPFVEAFQGRRLLVAYFHMWHDGAPSEDQCEGCTFIASHIQVPEYLHARDVTVAVFSEGTYDESHPYSAWLRHRLPWWSARGSEVVAGRPFGFIACFLRDDEDRVYETYWTTGRGTEAAASSYALLDLTVFGRQEPWEDSPAGWPSISADEHQWRVDGRPTIQWGVTDESRRDSPALIIEVHRQE